MNTPMDTAMEISFWKEEPLSPVFLGIESEQSDVWQLFEDEVAKEAESISLKEKPDQASTEKPSWLPDSPGDSCDSLFIDANSYFLNPPAQLATQSLQDLDEVLIKEEPFSDWLEQKVDLPLYVNAPPSPAAVLVPLPLALQTQPLPQPNILPLHQVSAVSADTQTLLQEFESVFGEVEQSHGALTPPQSPPHHPPHVTPDQLIAEVDEIVRSRVAETWPPSPCTSSNSSLCSPGTPDTPDSDPDWSPEPECPRPPPTKSPARARGRKRGASKPYTHSVEDKRLRKKEQNKNAATRYRMKKKAEVEEIVGEESELKDTNDQLQAKVTDLAQEIKYLKNLMREVFRAKGLIK